MHQEGNRNYTNNKSGLSLKVEMLLSKHKAGRCWSYWEGSLLLHRKARMACLHRCAFAVRSDRKGSTLWPREEHSAWREMQVKEFKQKWDWHLGGRRKIEEMKSDGTITLHRQVCCLRGYGASGVVCSIASLGDSGREGSVRPHGILCMCAAYVHCKMTGEF